MSSEPYDWGLLIKSVQHVYDAEFIAKYMFDISFTFHCKKMVGDYEVSIFSVQMWSTHPRWYTSLPVWGIYFVLTINSTDCSTLQVSSSPFRSK